MFKFLFNYIKKSPHRNQLESYVEYNFPLLKGSILDIGSKNRIYDHFLNQKPVSIDIIENKEKEVNFGDVNDLKFPDNSFDNVVCLEVLEYVSDINISVKEISRVVKPQGVFICSIPFMYRVHEDSCRYTDIYLNNLLSSYFSSVNIYPIGNFYTIILDIVRGKIIKIKYRIFRYFLFIFYVILVSFSFIARISKDKNYVSGYFIICHK